MKTILKYTVKHKYFLIFTVIYFVLGFSLYKSFGATYDEKTEYDSGKYLITYLKTPTTSSYLSDISVFSKDRAIHRDQLPIFSSYSRVYPLLLNVFNPNSYLEWFHFQNIFYGFFLFLFSYMIFYLAYKKPLVSMFGPILLFFTPIITGHVPANPKDIPFATVMLFGTLGIYFFGLKGSVRGRSYMLFEIIFLGVVFGIAQSLRTVGLTLLATYVIYNLFIGNKKRDLKLLFLKSLTICLISLAIWVIFVPYVGANVFTNIINVFLNAANFQLWDYKVLYLGKFLTKDARPWHYLFVYLVIQLPLLTLFGLVVGVNSLFTKKIKYSKQHPIFLLTIFVLLTFTLYFVFSPVIYNGIRHFLYLVVFLTLISGFVLIDFYKKIRGKSKSFVKIASISYLFFTLARMVHLHPYEYVYYNELIGGLGGAENKFELDYWGAAYKEATEYVGEKIEKNDLKNMRVSGCDQHFTIDYYSKNRFRRVYAPTDSDVIICDTFKIRLSNEGEKKPITDQHFLVKTIDREGVPLNHIYTTSEFTKYFE